MKELATEYASGMMGYPDLTNLGTHQDKTTHKLIETSYSAGYRSALTSLLKELPEVDEFRHEIFTNGKVNYREKIKSIIQNKLK